jgi:GT2 family glycosyltransferase
VITIAIPTYQRGEILTTTIERLLALEVQAEAIVVADQTPGHPEDVEARLAQWSRDGAIAWLRLDAPSIPHAMNELLLAADTDLVLFLDDDIEPSLRLVAEHVAAHADPGVWAVVGQILQPGEQPERIAQRDHDLEFRFNADEPASIANVMAGNLSVKREQAIAAGGFDENYLGAAYRFETDFARRIVKAGGIIRFAPQASLRHLKLASGGVRAFGDHLRTASPMHTVGDYYFAYTHVRHFWRYVLARLRKNVLSRYHVTHPWTIPRKLLGELRGLILAQLLSKNGPKLLRNSSDGEHTSHNRIG